MNEGMNESSEGVFRKAYRQRGLYPKGSITGIEKALQNKL